MAHDLPCGLSSLDIDIYRDHLLANDCLDYIWQLLSGDVDGNGLLSTLDLVEIQKAILEDPVSWPSWTFVPASVYNEMELPDCPAAGQNTLPEYDPFIDVLNVDDDLTDLDFVGIKMGDANATCEQCSEEFMGDLEVYRRTSPVQVIVKEVGTGLFEFSFDRDIEGLRVLFLAFECQEEADLIDYEFLNSQHFITAYRNGVYYVSYISFETEGETFFQGERIFRMSGELKRVVSGGMQIQNELISKDYFSALGISYFKDEEPKLIPNPSNGIIQVSQTGMPYSESTSILIYDALGREVMKAILPNPGLLINHNLPVGNYSYQLISNTEAWSGKLIVQ